MIIQHNMQAMNANRMLGGIVTSQSKVTEKLSSGYRINRAGDDAAGLSISEKMRAQINGLNRASTNAQDAISLIQTAEGALTETHSILQRMRELSVQAATDTNVEEDREALQAEVEQLTSEINRIAKTTQFNGMNLLDGTRSADYVKNAVYADVEYLKDDAYDVKSSKGVTQTGGNLSIASGITVAADADMDWTNVEAGGANKITLSKAGDKVTVAIVGESASAALNTVSFTDKLTADENGDYVYEEHGVSFKITKEEYAKWADGASVELNLVTAKNLGSTDGTVVGNYKLDNDYTNNKAPNNFAINGFSVDDKTGLDKYGDNVTIKITTNHATQNKDTASITITDAAGNVIDTVEFTKDMQAAAANSTVYTYDNHGITFKLDMVTTVTKDAVAENIEVTLNLKDKLGTETVQEVVSAEEESDNSLNFQVGANANQIINVSLGDMSAAALGVSSKTEEEGFGDEMSVATDGVSAEGTEYALDLTSRDNANAAITKLDEAIKKVSEQRSALGAVQNRLEHTIANLDTSAENLQAAESRIRDVDMAEEMVEYSKNNILQQAAQSMLAQANQSTQGVLSLLQ